MGSGDQANDGDGLPAPGVIEDDGLWRTAHASRAAVIVDAADYFHLMQAAMCNAKRSITLIGWDFDTRIALGRGRRWWNIFRRDRPPRRLGPFLIWLVKRNPDLEVRVLKWRFGAYKMFLRGAMLVDLFRWWRHDRITMKMDGNHPVGCSHHQKIAVIDDKLAVCGGIDMTLDRWDTREHLENNPLRRSPGGRKYDPWHDMTMMAEGEIAEALADLTRTRWELAGGEPYDPPGPVENSPWPDDLDPDFREVTLGIARTRAEHCETAEVREIETAFLSLIGRAKRFIYAESQYFASRKIAEAIAERMEEDDPPEIVVVNPITADGWLEQQAMDSARARILAAIGKRDTKNRFRLYVPHAADGTPIYVHAKLLIVDDEIMKIGSANMNNRSLGLDSECDLVLDTTRPGNGGAVAAIRKLRHSLLAEHCGLDEDAVGDLLEKYGSMQAMIEQHPQPGRALKLYELPDIGEVAASLADEEWLDPEDPKSMFEPMRTRKGLFRSRKLRRPR